MDTAEGNASPNPRRDCDEQSWLSRVRHPSLSLSSSRAAFLCCSALSLSAIWLTRFPLGTDLPQHANLFRLWADLARGPFEYREMYRIEAFTPYLLPYAVAVPLTKLLGAVNAIKCLLTFSALGTPYFLARWLKAVGAQPAFGLLGFVVAFDYSYIWGFISYSLAIPLMFAYLTAFELQGKQPKPGAIVRTILLGATLFFSHGIVFGFSMTVAGLSVVLGPRPWLHWRRLVHVIPLATLAAVWLVVRHKQAAGHPIQDWFNLKRAYTLFSGAFMPYANHDFAKLGAVGVGVFLLVARPRLRLSAARAVPLIVALLAFVALPEWIASTWLVGSRFCVFVHAFSGAPLEPRADRVARQWPYVLFALVTAFLVLVNVRLRAFNHELDGLNVIAKQIPPGSDLQTLVPETSSASEAFGDGELGQTPAWISAEHGGMIANDSALSLYFQIPLRRNDVPFPSNFRYVIAHGDLSRFRSTVHRMIGSNKLLAQSGEWLLFERPHSETQDFDVIRSAQSWGELKVDQNVDGAPLSIAHARHAHGLGTHANSFIRVRFKHAASTFEGTCGVDDSAGGRGLITFRILDDQNQVLFDSGQMTGRDPPTHFTVPIGGRGELLLQARTPGAIDYSHADWVDLVLR